MSSSHLSPIRRTASVIGSLLIAAGCTAPQEDQAPVTRSQPAPQADTPAATPPAATPAAPAASAPQILGTTVFEPPQVSRSEEHTSELQSLMRISYAVFCLKKKKHNNK